MMLAGLRTVRGPVEAALMSERQLHRRVALAARYATRHLLATVAEAVRMDLGRLTWLSWTPPCKWFTAGRLLGRTTERARRAAAVKAMRKYAKILLRALLAWEPLVVLGEEVAGLVTHCKRAMRILLATLQLAPYAWWTTVIDAVRLGAGTSRRRFALVGGRLGSLLSAPPAHAVGKRWRCQLCGEARDSTDPGRSRCSACTRRSA